MKVVNIAPESRRLIEYVYYAPQTAPPYGDSALITRYRGLLPSSIAFGSIGKAVSANYHSSTHS
jgi:hypothetical protein